MALDCVNVNKLEKQNPNELVDILSPDKTESLKFSIHGENYLFYLKRALNPRTYPFTVVAELVRETACSEGNCAVVDSLDISYVDAEIKSAVLPKVCGDLTSLGTPEINPIFDLINYKTKFYSINERNSNEYFVVVRLLNNVVFSPNYDYYTSTENLFLESSTKKRIPSNLLSFYIYLIFRISASSIVLEKIEIPVLKYLSSGACFPNTMTDETGFLKYEGNDKFLYAGMSYKNDDMYNADLLIYSIDMQSSQTAVIKQQRLSFPQSPQDYGMTSPTDFFTITQHTLHPVYNSSDLLILETNLRFSTDRNYKSRNFQSTLFKVIKFSSEDLIISNFFTPALHDDINVMFTDLLNLESPNISAAEYIDGKFFKLNNKIVFAGQIAYITTENLPETDYRTMEVRNYTFDTFPASFAVYDLDEVDLKITLDKIYFTGQKEYLSDEKTIRTLNSSLPIFKEKTTSSINTWGLFLNNSAKSDICQMIIRKYSIYDCSQIEFYFALNDTNNLYDHPQNSVQSFSDGCSFYMITAIRLLSSYEDFHASTNETPIDEYLAIVLFKFSFDEQGNLIKEYRILDVIKLYVVSPEDSYVGRQDSVQIPQIFFDNQKRLHYYVYVYRSLPKTYGVILVG